jgi:uncharacterized membrane protein
MQRAFSSSKWVVIVACLLFISSTCLAQRSDPETGRVRILYIGDGWGPSPVPLLQSDPAFTVISVPTSTLHADFHATVDSFNAEAIRKLVRLYMPRNYEAMLSKHDMTVLSDANPFFMNENHLTWIRDSVTNEGFGMLMVGGVESFGAPKGTPWTPLEDMLPVDITLDLGGGYYYPSFKVEPARDHPFTRSLPWETIPLFHGMNRLTLKPPAVLLLKAEGHPHPPLSYWEFGEGRSVAHAPDFTPVSGQDVMRWEYYLDYVGNIAYLATGSDIPEDYLLIHSLRTGFWSIRVRLTSVADTLNFVEKFGANTNPIERKMGKAEDLVRHAEDLYVRKEYDSARGKLEDIDDAMVELQEDAMTLKDQALFWVYAVEWTVTAGTSLLAGFIVWTLMIRRRLYREVSGTRLYTVDNPR